MNAYSNANELHLTQCEQLLNQVTVILQTVEDNNENSLLLQVIRSMLKELQQQRRWLQI